MKTGSNENYSEGIFNEGNFFFIKGDEIESD